VSGGAVNIERLAEQILQAWKMADVRHQISDFPCGVPDEEDIAALVNVAFFASLEREEADFVTFSLTYLLTHRPTKSRHQFSQFNEVMSFQQPVELSVKSLSKLAGAVDVRTSTLVVEKRIDNFVITGIAPFGRTPSLLGVSSGTFPRPEALTIAVRSPGSLLFSRSSGNLGRFSSGQFEFAQVSPFHSEGLGEYLLERVTLHDVFKRYGNHYWHWYRAALEHLLRSASGRGHGGAIIWVPKYQCEAALSKTLLGHSLSGFGSAHAALLALMDHSRKIDELARSRDTNDDTRMQMMLAANELLPSLKAKSTTLLNAIAQLACIDGATIIDDYLEPMKFGARLNASEWKGPVCLGETMKSGGGEVIRGRFGTRHNSAIDFVASVPDAIAFVLSQDGPIRAITRSGNAVLFWPDCLNTMFVE
jgi:hypothetical protein